MHPIAHQMTEDDYQFFSKVTGPILKMFLNLNPAVTDDVIIVKIR